MKKEIKEKSVNATIDEQRNELSKILPVASSGTVFLTIQYGEMAFRFPVPFIPREIPKKVNLQNRTLVDLGTIKMGIDVV